MLTFQDLVFKLQKFWSENECVVIQPYDLEMGAATFHPATCLRSLGEKPWKTVYVQPCRRPSDGRYGKNPNRLQHYYQLQVLLKPSPKNAQDLFLESLKFIGINPKLNDIKFIEDDWESPTLGAAGLGWEIQCNGMEISQYTYFQQIGGFDCKPVSVEFTYGLERIAMFVQQVENVFDITWNKEGIKYRELFLSNEEQFSDFNFNQASKNLLLVSFSNYESTCEELLLKNLHLPAYEYCIRASHIFNLLDSRGLVSVSERQSYILKIRNLSKLCCENFLKVSKNA
ncbi:MAG: glycine--tRNA ligase subunit alpha [Rickettsiales bacterium]|nr:glycine--tRNA ligase subunit alpha [Rickettsiales bacterium]OUV53415.1 MAG: glycine--tRNA ligase subunit alpha [Rickettsiales bacterium TMED127]|tara:strand:+ start:24306 stop:25160 length:855 start_codon:yes stop_codon:yes gene_type:complete